MADLNDAEVNRFINERARVRAEQLRDLQLLLGDDAATYTAEIVPKLPAGNSDKLLDGREAEGVDPLTKGELSAFISVAGAVKIALDAAIADVRKPTVRPPRI